MKIFNKIYPTPFIPPLTIPYYLRDSKGARKKKTCIPGGRGLGPPPPRAVRGRSILCNFFNV